jgi:hypothetical protein
MADGGWATFITPRRVLVLVLGIVAVGVVFARPSAIESNGSLTTFAADPGGARGFHETLRRLGWPTVQHLERFGGPLDSASLYVVLRPRVDLTSGEASTVLDAVRRGAGLLVVPGFSSTIMDSLGMERAPPLFTSFRPVDRDTWDSLGVTPSARWPNTWIIATDSAPEGMSVILSARLGTAARDTALPIVVGVPFGLGRIAVVSHGAILANGLFRDGSNSRLGVRLVEWLAPGRRPTIVFAEYHQGHGRHASVMRAIRRELVDTPAGRFVLHLLLAGGVLLLAVGTRPIVPRSRERVERRSPLEHIGALAQAYEQVGATRTAVRRLTRGLRRRHPIGSLRSASDDDYLTTLAARHPATAASIDIVKAGLSTRQPPERFREAGAAVADIERILRP